MVPTRLILSGLVALVACGGCGAVKTKPRAASNFDSGYDAYAAPAGSPLAIDTAPAPVAPAARTIAPVQIAPEPVAAPAYTPAPAASSQQHTITKGDTLWSISSRYYGDGKQFRRILEANPGLSETRLPIGKTITIP